MSEPDFLSSARVAIFGLGFMGGSLALALRGSCQSIVGIDLDPETIDFALQKNIVDQTAIEPGEILASADVIVLAAPISAILDMIAALPDIHPGSVFVFDIGSTKVEVVQALDDLPSRFDAFGGHPMCGKEVAGIKSADASIFQGATFAFSATQRTSPRAYRLADQLASAVGSHPLWLDAATHDRWTAATSHLPYLISAALCAATPIDATPLIGPGFRSTTRVAATPAEVMVDVLKTNQDNILDSLNAFRQSLDRLEESITQEDFPALKSELDRSAAHQRELLSSSPPGAAR